MDEQEALFSYSVALWLCWPSLFPEYVENAVVAASDLQAIEQVMRSHGVDFVMRAAVRLTDGCMISRYVRVFLRASGVQAHLLE